jgi:hypothetical protein
MEGEHQTEELHHIIKGNVGYKTASQDADLSVHTNDRQNALKCDTCPQSFT